MNADSTGTDARSRTLVFVCHCLLNQNAKVEPLAGYPGLFTPLVQLLVDHGVGIVQIPCPEVTHLGVRRPLGTDTREQYDTPEYRRVCKSIADHTSTLMHSYERDGYCVACVLGVEGSPSCSVDRAPALDRLGARIVVPRRGFFIQALLAAMGRNDVSVPAIGVPETAELGDVDAAFARIDAVLGLAAFRDRVEEPNIAFEDVVRDLKERGKI